MGLESTIDGAIVVDAIVAHYSETIEYRQIVGMVEEYEIESDSNADWHLHCLGAWQNEEVVVHVAEQDLDNELDDEEVAVVVVVVVELGVLELEHVVVARMSGDHTDGVSSLHS